MVRTKRVRRYYTGGHKQEEYPHSKKGTYEEAEQRMSAVYLGPHKHAGVQPMWKVERAEDAKQGLQACVPGRQTRDRK